MIVADQYWLALVISVFLPMVVALVTRQTAEGWKKAVLLLFLAAITGTLTQIQSAGGVFEWKDALVKTIVSFVVAVGVHFGLLKPSNLTGSEGKIQTALPRGII